MFGIGHWELLIIGFVAFLFFGQRLPGAMKSLGSSLRSFRDGLNSDPSPEDSPQS